jgi:hypothetical protein
MAVNKPVGDNPRKGGQKSQVKTKLGGATVWTKRNKKGGEFMAMKKPAKKKKAAKSSRACVERNRCSFLVVRRRRLNARDAASNIEPGKSDAARAIGPV